MNRSTLRAALLPVALCLSMVGCDRNARIIAGAPIPDSLDAPGIRLGTVLHSRTSGLLDTISLFGAIEVEAWNGGYAVPSMGLGEVLLFDDRMEYTGTLGRKGQGPGEFELVFGAVVTPDDRLAVIDRGNDRISIFDPDGRLDRTIRGRIPSTGDLAVLDEDVFLSSSTQRVGGALFVFRENGWEVKGRRSPDDPQYAPTLAVEVRDSLRIFRLEPDGTAVLMTLDGDVVSAHPLPEVVRTPAIERLAIFDESFPGSLERGYAVLPELTRTESGLILVRTGVRANPLVSFEPASGRWRAVDLGSDPTVRSYVLRSKALAATPGGLAILTSEDELALVEMIGG